MAVAEFAASPSLESVEPHPANMTALASRHGPWDRTPLNYTNTPAPGRGISSQGRDKVSHCREPVTAGEAKKTGPMSEAGAPSILIVDDDEAFRDRLVRALAQRGFDVRSASTPLEAVEHARVESPEFAVVDLRMPDGSGLELLRDLKGIDAATKVVVLTGYGSIASAIEAMRLGATHYLPKPATVDDILAAFRRDDVPPLTAVESAAEKTPSLARAEWEHMNRVLTDAGGNVSEAARRLGLHRRSLQRKLNKYPPKT